MIETFFFLNYLTRSISEEIPVHTDTMRIGATTHSIIIL